MSRDVVGFSKDFTGCMGQEVLSPLNVDVALIVPHSCLSLGRGHDGQ